MNTYAYMTKDNKTVHIHPEASHSHRPDLDAETIAGITINDRPFIRETVNLGRVIGVDHMVETSEADNIVLFQREGRPYESRMVLDRDPVPTENVSVVICKCGPEDGPEWDGKYVLVSLFEGALGYPEPYGRNAYDLDAIDFWKHHALVPTEEEMVQIETRMYKAYIDAVDDLKGLNKKTDNIANLHPSKIDSIYTESILVKEKPMTYDVYFKMSPDEYDKLCELENRYKAFAYEGDLKKDLFDLSEKLTGTYSSLYLLTEDMRAKAAGTELQQMFETPLSEAAHDTPKEGPVKAKDLVDTLKNLNEKVGRIAISLPNQLDFARIKVDRFDPFWGETYYRLTEHENGRLRNLEDRYNDMENARELRNDLSALCEKAGRAYTDLQALANAMIIKEAETDISYTGMDNDSPVFEVTPMREASGPMQENDITSDTDIGNNDLNNDEEDWDID